MKKANQKNLMAFSIWCIGTLFFLSSISNSCFALNAIQRIEIPSSPNPVGSGARALGMGGAFIAIADDATAASWNPGGLIQLEKPEISCVGVAFHRIDGNTFDNEPEASGNQSVSMSSINYLSAAYPFTLKGRNMVVSVNYQHLYDFTREWNFPLIESGENWSDEYIDYDLKGGLSALGLAYCIEITPQFSFGLTFNIWEDGPGENEWEEKQFRTGHGVDKGAFFTKEIHSFDRYSFSGCNFNLGWLWEVWEDANTDKKFTIGAVFKTPFKADLKYEHSLYGSIQYPELPPQYEFSKPDDVLNENVTMDMPMSYGIGFAYRFSEALTLSLDIYRTEWDDFVLTDSQDNETSPITGKSVGESAIDPTHQVRMGAEYLFIMPTYEIPLTAGLFYDPAPAEGSPDDFFGFSLGSGLGIGRFKFDIAYQCRFGNTVGAPILKGWGFSQDVEEHTVYSSLIVHF